MDRFIYTPAPLVALESFDFQGSENVGRNLTIVIDSLRKDLSEKEATSKLLSSYEKMFEDILQKRFKLNGLIFTITPDLYANAYAIPPDVNKNNILVRKYGFGAREAIAGKRAIEKHGENAIGWVDRSKAIVGGVFCDMECHAAITMGILKWRTMDSDEIAAVILHEIGHIMSYFEMMAYTFSTAFILMDTVERLTNAKSTEERFKIVDKLETATGVTISNKDIVVQAEPKTQIISIYNDLYEYSRSQFGSSVYDKRSWESLADQFAARMGMTRQLATGVGKLVTNGTPMKKVSSFTLFFMGIIKVTALVLITYLTPALGVFLVIGTLLLLTLDPFDEVYDRPRERIGRIRNEIFAALKAKDMPDDMRARLNADLLAIDATMKDIYSNEGLHDKIWLLLSSNARDQKKRRQILEDLESISNNELFGAFNLLKTIKKG